jgi:hypothetical protein
LKATDIIALVGVSSTLLVAIAGYIFNERRSRQDRSHEAQLQRSARLYESRRDAYFTLLRVFLVLVERVQRTEPIMTWEGMPQPPEAPPDEELRHLQARVGTFGSPKVSEAAEEFLSEQRSFYEAASNYRAERERRTENFDAVVQQLTTARKEALAAYNNLQASVSGELENL